MLRQFQDNLLVRNTMWMFLGQGFRILLQAAYFIIIARTLGANGYGTFIGVVALVAILAPFSSLGRGELLVMNVSRDKSVFREYWGNALVMTLISGVCLTIITFFVTPFIMPVCVSPLLLIWVAVSDLIFYRILDISGQSFQAFQRLKKTAQIQVLLGVLRLVGAVTLAFFTTTQTPEQWALLYFLSTLIGSIVAVSFVLKEFGTPKVNGRKLLTELKEGFYFSVSLSAVVAYTDINKTMLVKFSMLDAAGIYSAASRIMDVTLTPLRSLMSASYASFFREGQSGITGSLRFARKLLPLSVVYGVAAGIGLYEIAPFLPWLLGDDYLFAVDAVRFLSVIPILKCIQIFAADTLTGAGFQGRRSGIQAMVALLNVSLNFMLIPIYSWVGAVWVTIATEILLGFGYWVTIWYLYQKDQFTVTRLSDKVGG